MDSSLSFHVLWVFSLIGQNSCASGASWGTCQVHMMQIEDSEVIADIRYCDACYIPSSNRNQLHKSKTYSLEFKVFYEYQRLLNGIESNNNVPPNNSVYMYPIREAPKKEFEKPHMAGFLLNITDNGDYDDALEVWSKLFPDQVILTWSSYRNVFGFVPKPLVDEIQSQSVQIQAYFLEALVPYYSNLWVFDIVGYVFVFLGLLILISAYELYKRESHFYLNLCVSQAEKEKQLFEPALRQALRIPVFKVGYIFALLLSSIPITLGTLLTLWPTILNLVIPHTVFALMCAISFAWFNLRIVNAMKILKKSWKQSKRVAIAILPGLFVGGCLAAMYTLLRHEGNMELLNSSLLACICFAILLHIRLKSLGVVVLVSVIYFVSIAVMLSLDLDEQCSTFDPDPSRHATLFKNCGGKIRFGATVTVKDKDEREIPCEYSVIEISPFLFHFSMNFDAGLCQIRITDRTIPVWSVLNILFLAMYGLYYNFENSARSSVYFTVAVFAFTFFGLTVEIRFFKATFGLSALCPFTLLLILILGTAGYRKEIKFLFCGFPDETYYSPSRRDRMHVVNQPAYPTPIGPINSTSGASYRSITARKTTLPTYYDIQDTRSLRATTKSALGYYEFVKKSENFYKTYNSLKTGSLPTNYYTEPSNQSNPFVEKDEDQITDKSLLGKDGEKIATQFSSEKGGENKPSQSLSVKGEGKIEVRSFSERNEEKITDRSLSEKYGGKVASRSFSEKDGGKTTAPSYSEIYTENLETRSTFEKDTDKRTYQSLSQKSRKKSKNRPKTEK